MAVLLSSPQGFAQSIRLAVFDEMSTGEWTITFRDGSSSRKVCVRSGDELIQLRHPNIDCQRVIISNETREATVHYSCKGDGYGRTTIKRETRSLVQLSSQGFANDRPFELFAEARRTGDCK